MQSGAKKNIKDNYEDIAENLSSDYDVIISLKQCTPVIEEADVQKISQCITRSYNISKYSVVTLQKITDITKVNKEIKKVNFFLTYKLSTKCH
ncbi:Uncharacterised protein [Orientia tsutsugamushi]|uniref:Uncharacterized protein n=1 Tax=Orientia tsutsugamushi TaxID=784 RepID=A0A2U3QVL1_ORITS|nr:hypothetical protein [Orientia tsutsugamushi]KJV76194.1 ankyrin repeat-containing domain protein [Orientia tsutsugamushi str. UT76]SPR05025.1 Uncharacterised protein [Orientia tsutsugamushi]